MLLTGQSSECQPRKLLKESASKDLLPIDSLPDMSHTIIVNEKEFAAFDWTEQPITPGDDQPRHARGPELFEEGVGDLSPGEVFFRCDQTLVFDTTFELKGDGRQFVIITSGLGQHVAKPY
jgi:hypothetical protein